MKIILFILIMLLGACTSSQTSQLNETYAAFVGGDGKVIDSIRIDSNVETVTFSVENRLIEVSGFVVGPGLGNIVEPGSFVFIPKQTDSLDYIEMTFQGGILQNMVSGGVANGMTVDENMMSSILSSADDGETDDRIVIKRTGRSN